MKTFPIVSLGLSLLCALGCASKGQVKADPAPVAAMTAVPTSTPEPEVVAAKVPGAHYIVRPGDSLWKIAAMPSVLGDPMRWPVLYKQNRDQIEDPDLIEIKEDLTVQSQLTKDQIDEALRLAGETPPYAPHSAARKPLPLKY